MTHCAKCGAELIGMKKFCAACGSPVGDVRGGKATTGTGSSPAPPYGQNPQSPKPVNPFAETAFPSKIRDSMYGPPPEVSQPPGMPQVPPPLHMSPPRAPPPSAGITGPALPFATTGQAAPPPAPNAAQTGPALPFASTGQAAPPPPPQSSGPTPTVNEPLPAVSPLAVSNVASQRGAFEAAISQKSPVAATGAAPATAPKPDAPIPGTQLMAMPPSLAQPQPQPQPPAQPKPPQGKGRTQVMGAFPPSGVGAPAASLPQPSAQPSTPQPSAPSAPSAPQQPVAQPQPQPGSVPQQPVAQPQPAFAQSSPNMYGQNPVPPPQQPIFTPSQPQQPPPVQPPQPSFGNPYGAAAYPPQQPQQPAWGAPPAAPAWGAPTPQPYGGGFVAGARVSVTWSNGQRYPGTVQQTSGTQILVLFPDGQQHWVEQHYVTAG